MTDPKPVFNFQASPDIIFVDKTGHNSYRARVKAIAGPLERELEKIRDSAEPSDRNKVRFSLSENSQNETAAAQVFANLQKIAQSDTDVSGMVFALLKAGRGLPPNSGNAILHMGAIVFRGIILAEGMGLGPTKFCSTLRARLENVDVMQSKPGINLIANVAGEIIRVHAVRQMVEPSIPTPSRVLTSTPVP